MFRLIKWLALDTVCSQLITKSMNGIFVHYLHSTLWYASINIILVWFTFCLWPKIEFFTTNFWLKMCTLFLKVFRLQTAVGISLFRGLALFWPIFCARLFMKCPKVCAGLAACLFAFHVNGLYAHMDTGRQEQQSISEFS